MFIDNYSGTNIHMQSKESVEISGLVAGEQGAIDPPPPKFWAVGKLSENLLSQNIRPEMQNLKLKPPFW